LVAAASSTACGNDPAPVTAPTPVAVTETFSGTLTVNGGLTHPFIIQQTGSIVVTLTAVEPSDAVIGVSLGTWNGVTCAIVLANDNAVAAATVTGAATATGTYCARVYDVGKLTTPAGYEIAVTHY
jgi:hypothetical protein